MFGLKNNKIIIIMYLNNPLSGLGGHGQTKRQTYTEEQRGGQADSYISPNLFVGG